MRHVVAGLCCAIVGLEVLVAVPLVTCLVMFALFEDGGMPPLAMEVHAGSVPADLPVPVQFPAMPPLYPSSPPMTPVSIPTLTFPQPTTCPPPSAVADSCPPLSPVIESIAEAHTRNGGVLDGTIVAPDSSTPLAATEEFIAKIAQLATEESAPALCPLETTVAGSRPLNAPSAPVGAVPNGIGNQPCPISVSDSLQQAAHALYARALELEVAGDFARSDKIRRLAREIHSQIDSLARDPIPSAPVPSPGASAAAAPDHNAYSSSASIPSAALVPAQAELATAPKLPPETTIVVPSNIFDDEPEEAILLLNPNKPAEKPVPAAP